MSQFHHQKVLPYPPEIIFTIFKEQIRKAFPKVKLSNPIGARAEKDAKGVSGYSFHLNLEITDYKNNELYELTTHASNQQEYVSRYELKPINKGETLLSLDEKITTPGIFGAANALLTGVIFKGRAMRKAQGLFESIETELEKRHK